MALVASAPATQPEEQASVEAFLPSREAAPSPTASLSSLSGSTPARYHLRQEPSAIVLHAGICAGAGGQPPVLPRPADLTEVGFRHDEDVRGVLLITEVGLEGLELLELAFQSLRISTGGGTN